MFGVLFGNCIHHSISRTSFVQCTVVSTGQMVKIKIDLDPVFVELTHKGKTSKLSIHSIHGIQILASKTSVALFSLKLVGYKDSSISNICNFGALVKSQIFISFYRCCIYPTIFFVFVITLKLWLLLCCFVIAIVYCTLCLVCE